MKLPSSVMRGYSFRPLTSALSLPERFLLWCDLVTFVLPQKSLMPHKGLGTFKVQINRLGPCQWIGVEYEMNLPGDPDRHTGDGRLPERKTVIEGVFLGNPSEQILVTAQQHPDRVFPLRAGESSPCRSAHGKYHGSGYHYPQERGRVRRFREAGPESACFGMFGSWYTSLEICGHGSSWQEIIS